MQFLLFQDCKLPGWVCWSDGTWVFPWITPALGSLQFLIFLSLNLAQTCVPGQHSWEQDGFQSAWFSAWHTKRAAVGSATQIWEMDNTPSLGTDLSCFHEVHWDMAWLRIVEYLQLQMCLPGSLHIQMFTQKSSAVWLTRNKLDCSNACTCKQKRKG